MIYSIDYYAYTIPTEKPFVEGMFYDQQETVLNIWRTSLPDSEYTERLSEGWQHEHIHRFYQHRLRNTSTDITLSYGKTNSHVLVEFDGKACSVLDGLDLLLPIILSTSARTSRIDFAVDIECKVTPAEFISQRSGKSFVSNGSKYTPTGGTEYIGGRTSERMARVYRYYEPHPRHKFLRVEAEYKGDAAKVTSEYLRTHSVQETCLVAHKPFGWLHPEWIPDTSEIAKLPYRAYSPTNASTVRWLYGDVVTALRKAVKNDLIDFEEWLKFVRGTPFKRD